MYFYASRYLVDFQHSSLSCDRFCRKLLQTYLRRVYCTYNNMSSVNTIIFRWENKSFSCSWPGQKINPLGIYVLWLQHLNYYVGIARPYIYNFAWARNLRITNCSSCQISITIVFGNTLGISIFLIFSQLFKLKKK